MTGLGCAKTTRWLFLEVLVFAATSWPQTRPPIIERIAKTYGLDSFGQVEAIRYTWNGRLHGMNASRSWVWEPKTNKVSYEGKDKDGKPFKVTYLRSEVNSQPDIVKNEVDPAFINDNYGLLGALHVYWDTSAIVSDKGMHKLPVGNGWAKQVVVKYPSQGGYSPGDTWEFYVGEDYRVEQFVYHRGGSQKPTLMIASWSGYKKAGPLLISTEHRGTADGKPLRIFFSDVSVKLADSDAWMKAEKTTPPRSR